MMQSFGAFLAAERAARAEAPVAAVPAFASRTQWEVFSPTSGRTYTVRRLRTEGDAAGFSCTCAWGQRHWRSTCKHVRSITEAPAMQLVGA